MSGSARRHPLDVAASTLHRLAALLAVVFVAILVLMYAIWRFALASAPLPAHEHVPPPPRLERAPRQALATQQASAKADLERYAWVDRAHGIAEIPIERAMQILAARTATHAQSDDAKKESKP
jgi:hypothetical protein